VCDIPTLSTVRAIAECERLLVRKGAGPWAPLLGPLDPARAWNVTVPIAACADGDAYAARMDSEDLRLAVLQSFARTGRAPTVSELAGTFDVDPADVRSALAQLVDGRHLILGADGSIAMAHPFSAIPLGFSVMGGQTLWWGGCAWDSFALPHLLAAEGDVLIATRCQGCGTPHAWIVGRDAPPSGDQVAHFLTPAAHMWDDITHTCANQRIFCSRDCVADWLANTGRVEGYVMDLATLWRLASNWYDGRLDRGYVRRDPASAGSYLRSVGLSGPFWGL
jgi:hypothetical protein